MFKPDPVRLGRFPLGTEGTDDSRPGKRSRARGRGRGRAAWLVSGHAKAGSKIGSLKPVAVEAVSGRPSSSGSGHAAPRGHRLGQRGRLKIAKVNIESIDTDQERCSIPKGKFAPNTKLVVKPGTTEAVSLGVLHLPETLQDACQARR